MSLSWEHSDCQGAVQHRRLVPVPGSSWNEAWDEQGPVAIQARPLGGRFGVSKRGRCGSGCCCIASYCRPILSVGFASAAHSPAQLWEPLTQETSKIFKGPAPVWKAEALRGLEASPQWNSEAPKRTAIVEECNTIKTRQGRLKSLNLGLIPKHIRR